MQNNCDAKYEIRMSEMQNFVLWFFIVFANMQNCDNSFTTHNLKTM